MAFVTICTSLCWLLIGYLTHATDDPEAFPIRNINGMVEEIARLKEKFENIRADIEASDVEEDEEEEDEVKEVGKGGPKRALHG